MPHTPAQQRYAALCKWAQTDSSEGTAAAHAAGPGRLTYWEAKVDPDGKLDPDERAKRALRAKTAYYVNLGIKSGESRRRLAGVS